MQMSTKIVPEWVLGTSLRLSREPARQYSSRSQPVPCWRSGAAVIPIGHGETRWRPHRHSHISRLTYAELPLHHRLKPLPFDTAVSSLSKPSAFLPCCSTCSRCHAKFISVECGKL